LPALLLPVFEDVWPAVFVPPVTSPPAIVTGTLALTEFWSALAFEAASCAVSAAWLEI
jgi:hypothetical protein